MKTPKLPHDPERNPEMPDDYNLDSDFDLAKGAALIVFSLLSGIALIILAWRITFPN